MALTQAGKSGIITFNLKGREISSFVNNLQVYETLCKFYLTAKALIIDDGNIIDGLKIVGGEDVSFTFIADGGQSYSAALKVFAITKEGASKNKRALAYVLDMIGNEYFHDRINLVQQAFKNITGTGAISKIHQQYIGGDPLNVVVESMGLLFSKNSHVVNASKPGKAIDDIRRLLTFAQYPSGSTVYYHDRNSVNLAPAEHLFRNISPTFEFVQKATWGADYRDISLGINAIIDATTSIGNDSQASRSSTHDITAALKQEYKVHDTYSNKLIFNNLASLIPYPITTGIPFGSIATNIMNMVSSSQHGGRHNYLTVDTQKIPATSIRRTDKEQLFKAMIANGPQIYVKVPIQGGMNCTVGKGVSLRFLPPIGDEQNGVSNDSMLSGPALVADLTHDVRNDNMLSSTVMRCIKGGFNT